MRFSYGAAIAALFAGALLGSPVRAQATDADGQERTGVGLAAGGGALLDGSAAIATISPSFKFGAVGISARAGWARSDFSDPSVSSESLAVFAFLDLFDGPYDIDIELGLGDFTEDSEQCDGYTALHAGAGVVVPIGERMFAAGRLWTMQYLGTTCDDAGGRDEPFRENLAAVTAEVGYRFPLW